jgi:hypothetical protein
MAYEISNKLNSLKNQIGKTPVLALQIEGSNYIYGSAPILERAKWDDPRIDWDNNIGVTWDGVIERRDSRPYIDLKGDTTKSLTQQLIVDKGGSGSVQNMKIELIDYKSEVAKDLSFDNIGDPLGKPATIWLGLQGGVFPTDYIQLIIGYINDIDYNVGSISLSIALNTNLARQATFEKYQSIITSNIDDTQTNIPVEATGELLGSQDVFQSYVRIEDEIMEVVGINETDIDVQRGSLGTFPANHDEETDIESFYRLSGNPIDLALKLLLSKAGNEFTEKDFTISALNRIDNTTLIEGAIIVDTQNISLFSGASAGDLIELSGTASNDGIYTIQSFGNLVTNKSYIVVDSPLSEETGLNIKLRVKSQYDVLPDGSGLDVSYVDTEEFRNVKDLYAASFIDLENIKIIDTVEDTRQWIIDNIMRPFGLYLIPRKAKTSIKFTAPPFSESDIPNLNTVTLDKLSGIKIKRSSHKYVYNSIIYRYNQDILEDKFLDKTIRFSGDSLNRLPIGKRRLEIDAAGLRRTAEVAQVVQQISERYLDRYKFAASYVRGVRPSFEVGFRIEIGDIVFFGGSDTQLINSQTGKRDFPVAQYEVINKSIDIRTGDIVLELLETGFGIEGIRGTFSPSSEVLSGSTTTKILLGEIWDSNQYLRERDKWERWIGLKIRVRSEDYSFDETVTLESFDLGINNAINISPLSSAPPVGAIVELAKYTEYLDSPLEELVKLAKVFTMPSALITAVTDDKTFDVAPSDIGKFEIGMEINVHSEDYLDDSETRIIDDITGNTITLNENLNISPAVDYRIETYSFADAKGYRYL